MTMQPSCMQTNLTVFLTVCVQDMDGYDSSQSIPLMTTTKIISILQKYAPSMPSSHAIPCHGQLITLLD